MLQVILGVLNHKNGPAALLATLAALIATLNMTKFVSEPYKITPGTLEKLFSVD